MAAVVVTYHPDAIVLENLCGLFSQTRHLIVVDNGSSVAELAPFRLAAQSQGFELIENGENLGIAAALNLGIQRARRLDAEWVLLFDQDSRITDGFVNTMMRFFASNPWGERLAIANPRYVDLRFGTPLPQHREVHGVLESATTSGSLSPMRVFDEAGGFAEELFIDGVDYEYSLRLRAKGYVIATCAEATLLHSPGDPTSHDFLRLKPFQASNYAPIRRYYQERNKIWICKRYGRHFPSFFLNQFTISMKDLVKIFLVEKNSWRKCRYFMRGIADGLCGHMGRLDESSARPPA
ncbi:MAG TPA: glycosyltransferase family 2 protein [Acidobacteriaceae bacterium]|jgi:rhamnosyltransferase|nr:glycosyltransferase family 2 protein [Acidobacteriaceae bacterium]